MGSPLRASADEKKSCRAAEPPAEEMEDEQTVLVCLYLSRPLLLTVKSPCRYSLLSASLRMVSTVGRFASRRSSDFAAESLSPSRLSRPLAFLNG